MAKTYAIADLHGRYDLLEKAMLAIVGRAGDESFTVVTLGDYVDRGPDSKKIIDALMRGSGWPVGRLICLKGNHEDMMVETLTTPLHPDWWIGNGGGATLMSYGHPRSGDYNPGVVSLGHIEWLKRLPLMHVDKHRVFVHAGVDPTIALDEQTEKTLLWKLYPDGFKFGHGERHVVHGHHQFAEGPMCFEGRTDLDTLAWHTGRLVVGVFDDDVAGGPVDFIEVKSTPSQDRG